VDSVEHKIVSACTEQKRDPADWAEYTDEHDTVANLDLAFQVVFAVGKRFMGFTGFTPQEPQDLFA
jgi:hypothetical protein